MRKVAFLLMLIASAACSQKKSEKTNSDIFLSGEQLAEVTNKKQLGEASGLAASANNSGMLWTLNDSGNKAEVYLVDNKLDIKLICKLKGIYNRDWEDLTVGPGPEPGKNYLYVGEIGDNMAMFPYKHVYRFEEPIASGEKELILDKFDTITFQLPDAKKDTESLMIHPQTKNLYVISKREQPVYVYELKYPYSTNDTLTAIRIRALPLTQIVAADFSIDGKELLIKNYKNVFYWKVGDRDLTEALKEPPLIVKYKEEPQGESITFSRDGSGFYTISELVKGEKSYLYFYPRK
jgi:hypothetical protein